jgi:hypothetical protein
MTAVDREQLKRDCSDALEAHLREQSMDGLAELAETLRVLGPPYRFHGEHARRAAGRARQRDHLAPDPRAREAGEGRLTNACWMYGLQRYWASPAVCREGTGLVL